MRIVPLLALTLVGCLLGFQTEAQIVDDAQRYSEVNTLGTARSLGTSNSMSAIGADFTALQSNPAGLAAYRLNEFSFTLAPISASTGDATFDGSPADASSSNTRFAVPQAAFAFTVEPIGSRWTQVNFAVGVSQTNRFEERLALQGASPGSISDWFLETTNNYALDGAGFRTRGGPENFFIVDPISTGALNDFDNGLAFDTEAILANASDVEDFPAEYVSDYDAARLEDAEAGAVLQKEIDVRRKGYASSIDLSVAANYDERFLFGATLGLARSSFDEVTRYNENDAGDSVDVFDALGYRTTLTQSGTGIFARFGVIYRASQALRIGLAYHSPTVWSIDDAFSSEVTYNFTTDEDGSISNTSASPEALLSEYRITTPSQYRASLGVILGKRGFVSAEIGYLDYGGASFRISGDQSGFVEDLNTIIDNSFQSAVNVRVGGEVNLAPFQARLGGEYLGGTLEGDDASLGVSAGLGWRRKKIFVDLGYKLSLRPGRIYRPYNVQVLDFPQPQTTYTPRLSVLALTLGLKFGA